MATRNYELKKGVLLQAFGDASKTCTNDTLTDELAQWYLKNYPEKAIYFSKILTAQVVPEVRIIPPSVPNVKVEPEVKIISPVIIEPEASDVADTLIKTVTQSPNKRGRKSGG